MKISPTKWLTCFQVRPDAVIHLILFPFGGAAASAYRNLAASLPASVQAWAVQLPGRENRFNEPFCVDPMQVVQAVADEIDRLQLHNIAFFGHSMGSDLALLCHYVRRLQQRSLPKVLVLSGNKPPCLPVTQHLADAGDAALAQHVAGFGGIDPELLQDRDFASVYLEKIRADYRLYEAVEKVIPAPVPLDARLTVVYAPDDPLLAGVDMTQWQQYSRHPLSLHTLGSGHFYLQSSHAELADLIAAQLRSRALL